VTCRDEYLTLNGFKLHYLDWGGEELPPLLMVHGLTRQAHAFDGTARRLSGKFHCLAIDVRGRGESEWTAPESYNYDQYVADVQAFCEARGLSRFHYMGTSMGGHIGMHLASLQPERFASFVLNDIGPETAQAGSARIQQFVCNTPASFPSFEACLEKEIERFPWTGELPREELEASIRDHVRQNEDGSWSLKYDPEIIRGRLTDPEARKRGQEIMWKGFRALTCPTLLVRGATTDLLDMTTVEAMQEAQPDMRLVQVPGVGHAPSLNEPDVVAALEAFYG
jgi:pimeloyl-ACP methyl ester carboxylesterase